MEQLVWIRRPFGESVDRWHSSGATSATICGTGRKNCCFYFTRAVLGLSYHLLVLGYPAARVAKRIASQANCGTDPRKAIAPACSKCEIVDVSLVLVGTDVSHIHHLILLGFSPVNLVTYNIPTEYRVLFISFGKSSVILRDSWSYRLINLLSFSVLS